MFAAMIMVSESNYHVKPLLFLLGIIVTISEAIIKTGIISFFIPQLIFLPFLSLISASIVVRIASYILDTIIIPILQTLIVSCIIVWINAKIKSRSGISFLAERQVWIEKNLCRLLKQKPPAAYLHKSSQYPFEHQKFFGDSWKNTPLTELTPPHQSKEPRD